MIHRTAFFCCLALIFAACSDDQDAGPGDNTGGVSSGGQVSTGGAASGGDHSGGGGSGGAPTGGDHSGGAPSGGGSSGGTPSGGAPGGGAASGGGTSGPEPSAGCGGPVPNHGSSQQPLNVSGHDYYVKVPDGYDPHTPYPVLMMFHPTGNPISWAETSAGYEQTAAAQEAIRVYPASANNSSGWVASDVPFFQPFYEKILADYCVDTQRVFAAGESSGGDFAGILGCEHADKVRAIAPCATKNVPEYQLNAGSRSCTGQVAAVIIHGSMDSVVGTENGPKLRDFYSALNHCTAMSQPVSGYTDDLSNCILFEGCDEDYPVYWCWHQDPEYGETNHGWPKFAAQMTWEVLSNL